MDNDFCVTNCKTYQSTELYYISNEEITCTTV